MAETPAYLQSKEAKYALGTHRGFLPREDVDPESGSHILGEEPKKTISLEKRPTTVWQKIKRHWRRFWCLYMVFNVILLVIILPILFLVIIPAVAQLVVDKSDLTLVSARLMNPTPDSVVMSINSTIKLPLLLPVRINAFPMSLLMRDLPGNNTYAKVYIPNSYIDVKGTLGEENHPTPLNLPVWRQYVRAVLFQDTVMLSTHGRTEQHLGELHSMITVNKNVPLNGLGNFKGFAVEDSTLLVPSRPDGTNLIAKAVLPNPSPFILEIGKTVFDVKSGDLLIGNVTIEHLVLEQGNHTYPLNGVLDFHTVINNLPEILHQQRFAIQKGYLSLTTVGRSVTYNGQTIHYYEDPLKSLALPANIPIGDLLVNTINRMLVKSDKGGGSVPPFSLSGLSSRSDIDPSGLADKRSDNPGPGGMLSSLKDSANLAKLLNGRGLEGMLDKPDDLFAEALSRLA